MVPCQARCSRVTIFQKFREGVGWQRGLARGDPSYAKDSGLFSAPFFLWPPREKEAHNSEESFLQFFRPVSRQPPPANPFSEPLFFKLRIVQSSLQSVGPLIFHYVITIALKARQQDTSALVPSSRSHCCMQWWKYQLAEIAIQPDTIATLSRSLSLYIYIYTYICRRVSFGATFLPYQESGTVPH